MNERTDESPETPPEDARDAEPPPAPAAAGDPHVNGADGNGVLTAPALDPADELARAAAAAAHGGPPTPLGQAPSRRPRSRVGLFVWTGVLAAVVLVGLVYGPRFARRLEQLETQRACAGFTLPPGVVAYEEQPDKAAALLADAGNYAAMPLSAESEAAGPPVAGRVPAVWRAYRQWAFARAPEPRGALLFLHERRTSIGLPGVVAVEADRAERRLRVTFIYPGTHTMDAAPVTDVTLREPPEEGLVVLAEGRDPFDAKLPADPAARADLRFFAGTADPDDPTHFTIPYELPDYRGELEMWVVDERTVHYVDRRYAK